MKKCNSKLFWHNLPVQLVCLFLSLVIFALASMTAVYALPTGRMQGHLDSSMDVFFREDVYPELLNGGYGYMLDNFTDALMLNTAVYDSPESALPAAMRSARLEVNGAENPVSSRIQIYNGTSEPVVTVSYFRYWHGYLLFLKPLLLFFSYPQIRKIIAIVQFFLASAVIALLGYKKELAFIPPFVFTWLFLNPLALSASLQFNTVYTIAIVTLLIVIAAGDWLQRNRNAMVLLFFTAGCATSFFDLLTYPAVVLGLPLAYVIVSFRFKPKDALITIAVLSISWGAGYALMWAAKWLLSSLILHTNVLQDAMQTFGTRVSRTGLTEEPIRFIDVVRKNYEVDPQYLQLAFLLAIGSAVLCLLRNPRGLLTHLPILLVAAIPYAWFFVVSNHSIIHFFYTFRELAVAVFALLLFAAKNLVVCFSNSIGSPAASRLS